MTVLWSFPRRRESRRQTAVGLDPRLRGDDDFDSDPDSIAIPISIAISIARFAGMARSYTPVL